MTNKIFFKYLTYSLFTIILLSSTFNVFAKKEISYIELTPTIKANSNLNIRIATLDQREVVLKGNQDARFVGYIRSSVAIAYPIKNESDKNFSEVMSTTIENALKQNGCSTSIMKTNHSSSKEDVINELKSQEADIYILVTMTKWRSDTKAMNAMKMATELSYDLTVEIYSENGELIASNNLNKLESGLAPSGATSTKKIKSKVIDIKYPEIMTNLFANTEIEKALQ